MLPTQLSVAVHYTIR